MPLRLPLPQPRRSVAWRGTAGPWPYQVTKYAHGSGVTALLPILLCPWVPSTRAGAFLRSPASFSLASLQQVYRYLRRFGYVPNPDLAGRYPWWLTRRGAPSGAPRFPLPTGGGGGGAARPSRSDRCGEGLRRSGSPTSPPTGPLCATAARCGPYCAREFRTRKPAERPAEKTAAAAGPGEGRRRGLPPLRSRPVRGAGPRPRPCGAQGAAPNPGGEFRPSRGELRRVNRGDPVEIVQLSVAW